ncbi:MBL fold metallo-hydrolase [Effusibacillus lacus]|uniref:MBL fold metallo-hydrolase n=1 Tax=Effusibacillus lacus TaxID=1348429 RepID=A0A292YIW9_9BACL|nr:MBL fold metallo-hydrolase [Effusibacillus lacus]TCS68562.1 L-ascorbate metabolism protein UlaG (beta-lactamase superfamily) [Effusibacillus lacus]GAX88851.1 MBL fold metallo-hydrolase [Effusibacillus lacus]
MAGTKRYHNLDNVGKTGSFQDMLRWQKERKLKNKDFSFRIPQAENVETDFLRMNRSAGTITWIGHSTLLLQMSGLNILADPVWANRMGFEKRLAPPGIHLAELPDIDVVLISHSHYDHLHFASLRGLKGNPLHLVPEGLGKLFRKKGFRQVEELCWWDQKRIGGVEFHFVPAQHWSRRTPWDTNTSHWGGWVITSAGSTLHFVGDSGYFRGFKEIGQRFDIDYVLMPIGAYEPEWFMSAQHVTPEEAVKAYLDLRADQFIPMHYGAFRLADDTPKEALERLLAEWDRLGLPQSKLKILKHGETLRISGKE